MSAAETLRMLAEELRAKANDETNDSFYRQRCALFENSCYIGLRQNYTEEQLDSYIKHVKSNHSTLKMVSDRFNGVFTDDIEEDFTETDEQYRIPNEGQIEWLAIA